MVALVAADDRRAMGTGHGHGHGHGHAHARARAGPRARTRTGRATRTRTRTDRGLLLEYGYCLLSHHAPVNFLDFASNRVSGMC